MNRNFFVYQDSSDQENAPPTDNMMSQNNNNNENNPSNGNSGNNSNNANNNNFGSSANTNQTNNTRFANAFSNVNSSDMGDNNILVSNGSRNRPFRFIDDSRNATQQELEMLSADNFRPKYQNAYCSYFDEHNDQNRNPYSFTSKSSSNASTMPSFSSNIRNNNNSTSSMFGGQSEQQSVKSSRFSCFEPCQASSNVDINNNNIGSLSFGGNNSDSSSTSGSSTRFSFARNTLASSTTTLLGGVGSNNSPSNTTTGLQQPSEESPEVPCDIRYVDLSLFDKKKIMI